MEHSLQKYLERLPTEILEQYAQDESEGCDDPVLLLIQEELEKRREKEQQK